MESGGSFLYASRRILATDDGLIIAPLAEVTP